MSRNTELQYTAKVVNGVGIISLAGNLVAKTRFDVERVLRDWTENEVMCILVRCSGLQQLDSGGLSALLSPIPRVHARGGDIVLSEVNPNLKALFQVATIKHYLKTFTSQVEALNYLRHLTIIPVPVETAAK